MEVQVPATDFVTVIEDSRRWRGFEFRDGDIVISTPPKSGTTWMQGIVHSLLWPAGDAPGRAGELSPWIDMRLASIDELFELYAAQEHRRFMKTHTPADSLEFRPSVSYVLVYRDPADALVSWGNHRAAMRPEVMEALNEVAAADGLDPLPLQFTGDYDELFDEWSVGCSPARHLASWWDQRHLPNVHVFHYTDLIDDLSAQMRRLATVLDLGVPDGRWREVVERCHIDAMRNVSHRAGRLDRTFEQGADSFFYRGGNGRGAELLDESQSERVRAHVAALLPPEAEAWLRSGGPLPS